MNVNLCSSEGQWASREGELLAAKSLRAGTLQKELDGTGHAFAQAVRPGEIDSPASNDGGVQSLHEFCKVCGRKVLGDFPALLALSENVLQDVHGNFLGLAD